MKIKKVVARSFGPLSDQELEFAEHMTVIYGPNESGKSTWHAATYLGICGMRRGPGMTTEARQLTDQYKPWDLEGWAASVTVVLEDGRRVEIEHDFVNHQSSAVDVASGRDYSNEVINEGAVDGSLWLGLDRRSFRSTACVRQVEIQDVIEHADALQEHLQRAAATAGTEATAAAAISKLTEFRRENVGLDRSNSTKPLRSAIVALDSAQKSLEVTREKHRSYVKIASDVEEAEAELDSARIARRALEAAIARAEADRLAHRVLRAEDLAVDVPEEPESISHASASAETITKALEAWRTRPSPVSLTGASSSELMQQVEELPPVPTGDVGVHATVEAAEQDWRNATAQLRHHEEIRPDEPASSGLPDVSVEELRRLALDLSATVPELDQRSQARRDSIILELDSRQVRRMPKMLLSLMAVTAMVGVGLALVIPLAGLALVALAGSAFIVLLLTSLRRDNKSRRAELLEELREIESRMGSILYKIEDAQRRRAAAAARLRELGLPNKADEIESLAGQLQTAKEGEAGRTQWDREYSRMRQIVDSAADRLLEALVARGGDHTGDPETMLDLYEDSCNARQMQAAEAGKRKSLEEALAAKRLAEKAAQEADQARDAAEHGVTEAANLAGLPESDVSHLVPQLESWLQNHRDSFRLYEARAKQWQELRTLLGEQSLEDLELTATRKRQEAKELTSALPPGASLEPPPDDADDDLERHLKAERAAAQSANQIKGRLDEYAKSLGSVPLAEEAAAAAATELARIRKLDKITELSLDFLENAQVRTHRTIAPLLRDALQRWLPNVTNGRYSEVRIDPETLQVRVRGAGRPWRDAQRLSHGTAEQIYLLLRVAMSEYLTAPGEKAPLLLDDVTVQADVERQEAILRTLKTISDETQVILFSQELDVLEWAKKNLDAPDHAIVSLPQEEIPA